MSSSQPFGHPVPFVSCRDVPAAAKFYRDKLGFEICFEDYENPDFHWASIVRDNTEFSLITCQCEDKRHVGNNFCSIETEDIDGLFAQLKAAGVEMVYDQPEDRPWGMREFKVSDPDGNWIMFAGPIPEVD